MLETDPQHWFLPSVPFSGGNAVVALVDGAAFMAHLYDRTLGMVAGDALFFTMWRGTPSQLLRPELQAQDTQLLPVLCALVQRRILVRILGWAVPLPSAHTFENVRVVRGVRSANQKARVHGSAYLDERLPARIASHHQKSLVLTSNGEPWAYVGGIDVSVDRWDTPEHASSRERQHDILDAWHDIHCAIQGPAVLDIAENFRERWNERKPPLRSAPGDLPELIRAPLDVPLTSRGSLAVQRLRTLACGVYDFAPRGEQTSRAGINQAIDRAKYYVYLEDQYFWPSTTVERLTEAVRRGVYVFLVLAKANDQGGVVATAHYEMRQAALEMLRSAGADRVTCCHLEQLGSTTQIYVHSKFMIVDDRFVTIGSTNVGRRSHTTDSELNVSIVDTALEDGVIGGTTVRVAKFARALRRRVWNEHLNVPIDELADPIAARARWPRQVKGSRKVHHAAYHSGVPPTTPITLADWYRLLKALRDLARLPTPWPNVTADDVLLVESAATTLETLGADYLNTGVSELALRLALGPVWWAPKIGLRDRLYTFLKDRLMNVETRCS